MDGTFKTIYNNMDMNQLHALFSTEQWKDLTFSQRMNACQEVENRYAASHNVQPCKVTHEEMQYVNYGNELNQTITLNTYLVRDGQFHTTNENSQPVITTAPAPNWSTLETIYHEGTHGIQEALKTMPSTYFEPESDYDLYRIQAMEKEAFKEGQTRTENAILAYENSSHKFDDNHISYLISCQEESFRVALEQAIANYKDPNIENELNNFIYNNDHHIQVNNPSATYQAISNVYSNQLDNYYKSSNLQTNNSLNNHPTANNSENTNNPATNKNTLNDGLENTPTQNNAQNSTTNNVEQEDGLDNNSSDNAQASNVNTLNDGLENTPTQNNAQNLTTNNVEQEDGLDSNSSDNVQTSSENILDDGLSQIQADDSNDNSNNNSNDDSDDDSNDNSNDNSNDDSYSYD